MFAEKEWYTPQDFSPGEGIVQEVQVYEAEIKKFYNRNFIVGIFDGAFFWLGYSFIAPGVILPLFVSHFTTNPLLIGLIAVIANTGFLLPQILTANWVSQLPRKKYLPVNVGFFTERLPLLILPIATVALSSQSPEAMLAAFFALFTWHSFGAGLVAVGWQDMVAKIIPVNRRGRFMGWANALGTATGVVGATFAAWLLTYYLFPTGFVICFSIGAAFILISWFCLTFIHEPASINMEKAIAFRQFMANLPKILRRDRNFSNFIFSQTIFTLAGMGWGFQAVYALERWGLTDGQVGAFTIVMLVGQALASFIFGLLADRSGYKLVVEIGILAAIFSFAITLVAPNPLWLNMAFFLRGINGAAMVLIMMLSTEFSREFLRPSYIGLTNTTQGIASAMAPLVGGLLAIVFDYNWLFRISILLSVAGLVCLHWMVHDPRFFSQKLQNKEEAA